MSKTNRFKFRSAKVAEAKIISDLALRSKGHWPYDAEFLANCKEELSYSAKQLQAADYCFKVAQLEEQKIAGFFALCDLNNQQVELEALFVEPEFIGQGLGQTLLKLAKDTAKKYQATSIRLQSDPYAENFYLANGAVKVAEKESESIPGRFLPLMEISL